MSDAERAQEILVDLRKSIDNLDAVLVHTLAERFRCTTTVGRLKAEHDLPPADPAREASQIERLERMCSESGLDDGGRRFGNFGAQSSDDLWCRARREDQNLIQLVCPAANLLLPKSR